VTAARGLFAKAVAEAGNAVSALLRPGSAARELAKKPLKHVITVFFAATFVASGVLIVLLLLGLFLLALPSTKPGDVPVMAVVFALLLLFTALMLAFEMMFIAVMLTLFNMAVWYLGKRLGGKAAMYPFLSASLYQDLALTFVLSPLSVASTAALFLLWPHRFAVLTVSMLAYAAIMTVSKARIATPLHGISLWKGLLSAAPVYGAWFGLNLAAGLYALWLFFK
jgi:hypothetical protein